MPARIPRQYISDPGALQLPWLCLVPSQSPGPSVKLSAGALLPPHGAPTLQEQASPRLTSTLTSPSLPKPFSVSSEESIKPDLSLSLLTHHSQPSASLSCFLMPHLPTDPSHTNPTPESFKRPEADD